MKTLVLHLSLLVGAIVVPGLVLAAFGFAELESVILELPRFLSKVTEWAPSIGPNVLLSLIGTAVVCGAGWMIFRILVPRRAALIALPEAVLTGYVFGCALTLLTLVSFGVGDAYTAGNVWLVLGIVFVGGALLLQTSVRRKTVAHLTAAVESGNPALERDELTIRYAAAAAVFWLAIMPLFVSLTMPVPSWMDVLETNLAPVQRVVAFESYWPVTALPSAHYPPNRSVPLYTAFFAFLAKPFGLDANQIIAASLVPNLLVTLLSVWCLARSLAGPLAAMIALWFWSMSFNYVHLQDQPAGASRLHFMRSSRPIVTLDWIGTSAESAPLSFPVSGCFWQVWLIHLLGRLRL